MKVALVSFHFMETSIPLAKNLSLKGIDVDLYCVMPQGNQNTFVFDFTNNKQPNGFIDPKITKSIMGEKLLKYLSKVRTKVFIYPNRRLQKYLLGDLYYAFKLSIYIKKNKYDIIHIVQASGRFWLFFYIFSRKNKIIQTLHEVTSHEAKTPFMGALNLKCLVRNSTPIIFHSNISRKRFLEFRKTVTTKKIIQEELIVIRFGLFETYHLFSKQPDKYRQNDKINILNFGRIVPYKGIDLLVEAVKLLQDRYPIHLVIAGTGIPYFDLNEIKSYRFINEFISNEEIVSLIEGCDMVVLPYTSVSQSGIPMTVYAFNKPIVASNIDGLAEIIDHLKTGILVDDLNGQSFASSIEKLLLDKTLNNDMVENIKKKYCGDEFSWPSIADKTLNFYQKRLKKPIVRL